MVTATVASGPRRGADSTGSPAVCASGGAVGSTTTVSTANTPVSAAAPSNVHWSPTAEPTAVPTGTPRARPSTLPAPTNATARPARDGGTALTAAANTTEKNPACATPPSSRAPSATG